MASILMIIVIGILFFVRDIYLDTPQFFPLKRSQGDYKITKECPRGSGWQETNVLGNLTRLLCFGHRLYWSGGQEQLLFSKHVGEHLFGALPEQEAFMDVEQ